MRKAPRTVVQRLRYLDAARTRKVSDVRSGAGAPGLPGPAEPVRLLQRRRGAERDRGRDRLASRLVCIDVYRGFASSADATPEFFISREVLPGLRALACGLARRVSEAFCGHVA